MCCIFWPAFGCCPLQTLVETVIFSIFNDKKLKKAKNFRKILQKSCFLSLHQNAGRLFYSLKKCFIEKSSFFGNKIVNQRFGANLKKRVVCKILLQIFCFLSFLAQKMLKMTILTSIWSVQHPNAGQNIQHMWTNPILYTWLFAL